MSSPDVVGATVVEQSPDGLVVLLDDGTRRTVDAHDGPAGSLRTGQRLQVRLGEGVRPTANWPTFSVEVAPRA